ncbi:c-type cytochrome [Pseudomonas sp. Marseille-Q5115]|uniref:c-type cytochrome n=1 Tax=Pseudomonas sp. Marseille-Q5115 TaxID=2866593 RepID=UPI001CE3EE9A|nr:cytochrome c family protein [Pseudomonas sp. Marseille-Q5115]
MTLSPSHYLYALLMLTAAAGAQAEGDAEAGRAVFQARCSGCHSIGPGAQHAFGPLLTGVVGRHTAGSQGYQYSEAMRNAGFVWTEEKLKAYIDDPKAVVPGTRMNFWWIGSEQKLSDLVAYLASQPTPAP